VVLNDAPQDVWGAYNVRGDVKQSDFAVARTAEHAFSNLFKALATKRCKHVAMSYSSGGTLSLATLKRLLREAGYVNVRVFKHVISKYKALLFARTHRHEPQVVTEYLIVAGLVLNS
jgi:adenine-specific DNA methylase